MFILLQLIRNKALCNGYVLCFEYYIGLKHAYMHTYYVIREWVKGDPWGNTLHVTLHNE